VLNDPVSFIDPAGLACGAGFFGLDDLIVPDCWFGKYDFTNACQTHDQCYATPGASKEACDDQFYRDMRKECDQLTGIWKSNCWSISGSYHEAVRNLGNGFYGSSQKQSP
jgi:hypothetical protein